MKDPLDRADDLLVKDLEALGLDARSFRAIVLLPLIEVAWADHAVQDEERRHILQIAKGHSLLSGRGAVALERWLTERPTDEQLALGRELLVRLAHQRDGLGADLPESALDTIVEMCTQVAEAAGGVLGMFWRVSPDEQAAVRQIADAIESHAAAVRPAYDPHEGQALTPAWEALLDEVATRDEIDLDALEAEAAAQGVSGRPPDASGS